MADREENKSRKGSELNKLRTRIALALLVVFQSCLSTGNTTESRADQIILVPARGISAVAVGDSIGKGVAESAQALGEVRVAAAEAQRDLTTKRNTFFRLYPDGPGIDKARQEFADALFARDLLILHLRHTVMQHQGAGPSGLMALSGMPVKNGIPTVAGGLTPGTRSAYLRWERDVQQRAEKQPAAFLLDPRVKTQVINASREKYWQYARFRDLAEFHAAGRQQEYFSNASEYLHFVLSNFAPNGDLRLIDDKQVQLVFQNLVARYGYEQVIEVADLLWRSEKAVDLRLVDSQKHGVPTIYSSAYTALLYLLAEKSSNQAFAQLFLIDPASGIKSSSQPLWVDGEERTAAIVQQHGQGVFDAKVSAIRSLALNEFGSITEGQWKGKSRTQALLLAMPLSPDPVAVRLEREREAYQRKVESERIAQETEMRERGRRESERIYQRLLRAVALGRKLDAAQEERLRRFSNWKPAVETQDPMTLFEYRAIAVAGIYNQISRQRGVEISTALRELARHPQITMPQDQQEFFGLLQQYLGHSDRQIVGSGLDAYLTPLDVIQQEFLAVGKITEDQVIDLSMTARRYWIEKDLRRLRASVLGSFSVLERRGFVSHPQRFRESYLAAQKLQTSLRSVIGHDKSSPLLEPLPPFPAIAGSATAEERAAEAATLEQQRTEQAERQRLRKEEIERQRAEREADPEWQERKQQEAVERQRLARERLQAEQARRQAQMDQEALQYARAVYLNMPNLEGRNLERAQARWERFKELRPAIKSISPARLEIMAYESAIEDLTTTIERRPNHPNAADARRQIMWLQALLLRAKHHADLNTDEVRDRSSDPPRPLIGRERLVAQRYAKQFLHDLPQESDEKRRQRLQERLQRDLDRNSYLSSICDEQLAYLGAEAVFAESERRLRRSRQSDDSVSAEHQQRAEALATAKATWERKLAELYALPEQE
ncbi:MAG: hypothetical protein AAF750_09090 [Planctomycetota bacterium]